MSGVVVASVGVGVAGAAGLAVIGAAAVAVAAVATPIVAMRAAVLVGADINRQWREIGERERAASRERESRFAATLDRQESVVMVMETNAAIAVLAATASRYRPRVPVPAPLEIGRQSDTELRAWCRSTDAALREIEGRLAGQAGADYAQSLLTLLRIPTTDRPPSAPDGDRPAPPDRPATAEPAGTAPRRGPSIDLAAELTRVVSRLDPLVSTVDLERVRAAAAGLSTARTGDDAHNVLTEVRVRVQEANSGAARQRADALDAARLLQALADRPGIEAVRTGLAAVLAGAPLTTRLRSDALSLVRQAAEDDAREYLRRQLMSALDELQYDVLVGFETLAPAQERVVLGRPGWREHAVAVVLDHDSHELRAAVVRTATATTEEDRRVDADREQQWCDSYADAVRLLADAGIRLDASQVVPPGGHELTVIEAPRRSTSDTDRTGQAHRRPTDGAS